ncbi:six-hairpin glycosidase-like protein [Mucilaginibacter litoreus]|uniref:Six-hairpin glycosidase-like protein n=1 Tax=Mucilaginibacter litoreus TaxID=1048221 RepID=A0ABW3ATV5_9SPHI
MYLPTLYAKSFAALLIISLLTPQFRAAAQDFQHQNETFWKISNQHSTTWDVSTENRLPHHDNIEMSGTLVSGIIRYSVNKRKQLKITRDIIFPQLRKFSRSDESIYRAYLRDEYEDNILPVMTNNRKKFECGPLDSVRINGKISFYFEARNGIRVIRSFFPSMSERMFVEKWILINTADTTQTLNVGPTQLEQEEAGYHGTYHRKIYTDAPKMITIEPHKQMSFAIYFTASLNDEPIPALRLPDAEAGRDSFLDTMSRNLILRTPDPNLNTLFYFSKIRAAESIFKSKYGLVHSPGGGNYYVGIWANDQAEYSGPFFPYLGYQKGITAAMNAYRIFQNNIPKDGGKIWASFEMDVTYPFGKRDRGDAAMIAFGATHFLLASGDQNKANELWPLITWCLDYCKKRTTADGIVASESDELEGRFPSGSANLSTSSLYYGALIQAARLARAMNKPASYATDLEARAARLSTAIEKYFGADMNGLKTYRYYKENTTLRSWICLPLVVGLNERKQGTLDALFNELWSANGVLTEGGGDPKKQQVFWDRWTLYAFRGAFKAGEANKSLDRLLSYSKTRLTGFRVPYAVEAWPENGMAHLSAESALYCRIFTEGLLGLEPTGFKSFTLAPHLPDQWDHTELDQINAFGTTFDIHVQRTKSKLKVTIKTNGKAILQKIIAEGSKIAVTLN